MHVFSRRGLSIPSCFALPFLIFILSALFLLHTKTTYSVSPKGSLERRATMAPRALLQRLSSRRAISAPRVSTFSALNHSSITKCNSYNTTNRQLNNFNIVSGKRHFSFSGQWNKELKTMSEEEVGGLRVQEERLMRDLHETCEWGKGERWGR